MSIVIQEITDSHQWDGFLTSQPHGHLLQSYNWGKLHSYLGARVYRLGALENGSLIGTMQFSVNPVPFPLPLLKGHFKWLYCVRGPSVASPSSPALAALIEQAHIIARKERAVVLRIEPDIADDDPIHDDWIAAYQRLGFRTNPIAVHGRRSWVLDIRPDLKDLYARFRKTWRYDIRLAERAGVKIREAKTEADFDTYYDLLHSTSVRDGFFIHEKQYHKEIWRRFVLTDNGVLYLAELDGQPMAAKLLIQFGNWCWDMFGASANERPEVPKTHLIQYRSIQWAKERGCTHFDFRTIPEVLQPGEEMWGIYHFKKGFGGFSRLHMPTQDYIYQPQIYQVWRTLVELRRAHRQKKARKKLSYGEGRPQGETESVKA